MNDFDRFIHAAPKEGAEAESEIRELLQAAGPRPDLPEAEFTAIKEAARGEWRAMVATQRASRSHWGLALAASLVLALAAAWWWQGARVLDGLDPVASVLRVDGEVRASGTDSLFTGAVLTAGSEIETAAGTGRLALRLSGGESVRIDASTRVRLAAGNRLELESGAVYFDSAGGESGRGIEIATEFGTVRDIGTQFEVRLDEAAGSPLRVRVREGAVALEREGGTHSAARGEELRMRSDGGVEVSLAPVYGPDWAWVLAAAPTFDIHGQPLARYLEWLARETGWSVSFDDPELAASAATVRLSGTIEGLTPDQSISVVLPGSGLDYRLENGELSIFAVESN